ncbi:MAG TPA: hypothetical protein VF176_06230 [Solirubrobacterales bacterium]
MRKLITTAAAAALLLLAIAAAVQAAGGARLNGSFNVTATIQDNDIGIPVGTDTTDVYVFKSTCKSGACSKVGLIRKSGGRNVKSTLHKTAPGVYKGTEGPEPYVCVKPIGAPGQFTGDHKIKVTKSANGLATKVSGTTAIHITGCTETFEDVALKGKLK